jgi:hypothetical protein
MSQGLVVGTIVGVQANTLAQLPSLRHRAASVPSSITTYILLPSAEIAKSSTLVGAVLIKLMSLKYLPSLVDTEKAPPVAPPLAATTLSPAQATITLIALPSTPGLLLVPVAETVGAAAVRVEQR